MLNGAQPSHAHPSASGSPSAQAPSNVGSHIRAEGDPIVLPREVVDAPQAHDQVARQPDQGRPLRG
eukprot:9976660-Alexandrium_andersonii.AAC.1